MDDQFLEVRGITKRFPGVVALSDVSFSCAAGEVHAIVGENGAGKSTLMKVLSGVYQPDGGEILIDGKPVVFHRPTDAQEHGISIIFQEFSLLPGFSVAENIYLNREETTKLGFVDRAALRRRARALVEQIGVDLDVGARVEHLSVVQQQIVEILKAISFDARVVIMDEPSAPLTDIELQKLFAIIRTLKSQGVTVIYISHLLEEIFEISDRVTVFKDGTVMGTRKTAAIDKDILVSMMVGRDIKDLYPERSFARERTVLAVGNLNRPPWLTDISFKVSAGEILGVAGIVGSGRSYLAKCIYGAEEYASGEIRLNGELLTSRGIARRIDDGIAYVTEDRKKDGIVPFRPIRDNITVSSLASLSWGPFVQRDVEKNRTRELIDTLNIRATGMAQEIQTLSGGNQQKCLIARWMLDAYHLLIFDEPTRGVDIGAKAEIYRIIREVADKGHAVIVVSSDLPEVIGLSDRIMVMRRGEIAGFIDQSKESATEEQIMSLAVGHHYEMKTS